MGPSAYNVADVTSDPKAVLRSNRESDGARHIYEVIVIGAGQAGLATGWHLKQRAIDFVMLEKGSSAGGSWASYYDSLELFSPARYSSLPGRQFPGDPRRYPKRDEVTAYLRDYADRHELPVTSSAQVTSVTRRDHFDVATQDGRRFGAKALVVASGGFGAPHIPHIAGQHQFEGSLLHSSSYRRPEDYEGQNVVVVGAGNSAVQIACELANVSNVTLAVRDKVRFLPQRLLGQDLHFWLHITGLDRVNVFSDQGAPVVDDGRYKNALAGRRPPVRKMFTGFWREGVEWDDGSRDSVDAVIFATGFRYSAAFLAGLGVLDASGEPLQHRGRAIGEDRLFFVGIPGQRSFSSATLRGVGRDAAFVARQLTKELSKDPAASPERIGQLAMASRFHSPAGRRFNILGERS